MIGKRGPVLQNVPDSSRIYKARGLREPLLTAVREPHTFPPLRDGLSQPTWVFSRSRDSGRRGCCGRLSQGDNVNGHLSKDARKGGVDDRNSRDETRTFRSQRGSSCPDFRSLRRPCKSYAPLGLHGLRAFVLRSVPAGACSSAEICRCGRNQASPGESVPAIIERLESSHDR